MYTEGKNRACEGVYTAFTDSGVRPNHVCICERDSPGGGATTRHSPPCFQKLIIFGNIYAPSEKFDVGKKRVDFEIFLVKSELVCRDVLYNLQTKQMFGCKT